MQTLTIKELLALPVGAHVPSTGGLVTAVDSFISGENTDGTTWSSQGLMIEDATGSIPVKVINHPDVLTVGQKGDVLYFAAIPAKVARLAGVKIERETFEDKVYSVLSVTKSGLILTEPQFEALQKGEQSKQMNTNTSTQDPAPPPEPKPAANPGMRMSQIRYSFTNGPETVEAVIEIEPGTSASKAVAAARAFMKKQF